jgi:hypothetical protein
MLSIAIKKGSRSFKRKRDHAFRELTPVVFSTPTALAAHSKQPAQAMRNQTVSALL